jgi:hypothetical protein
MQLLLKLDLKLIFGDKSNFIQDIAKYTKKIRLHHPMFQDPFLQSRLNPLFLETVQSFWDKLDQAKGEDQEQVKTAKLNLLRFVLRRLFQPIYLENPPEVKGTVYFLAVVHPDGIGDYFSLLKSARSFKANHPEIDVHIGYTHQVELPPIDPRDYLLAPDHIHPFFCVSPGEALSQMDEGLKKALAIVHIALSMNTFDDPVLGPKSFYFAETTNFQGIGNYLQRNWYSMGLQPFEEGIFLKRTFDPAAPWKDKRLEKLFEQGRATYLAYLGKIPEQLLLFIYLVILQQKEDPRDIDLIIPKMIFENNLMMDTDWVESLGIRTIKLLNLDKSREYVMFETEAASQKTLRLIPALPLQQSDFEKVTALSEDLVGCTGDGSLSDCLIVDKIPFYELRSHKLETWVTFGFYVSHFQWQEVIDYLDTLAAYKETPLIETAKKLHEILNRPQFKVQWKALLTFLKQYGSFEDALNGHLNRHLHLLANLCIKETEDNLAQAVFNGTLSFEVAYKNMQDVMR